jgi:L-ascorbate metabolism protein UlaG (beta-lactamase superfamily)
MRAHSTTRDRRRANAATTRITWLGHATVLIELGGVRLLTDPVLRGRMMHLRRHGPAPEQPAALDAVLISHLHYDHADLPSLRRLESPRRLVCPPGAGDFLAGAGLARVEELPPGRAIDIGGVEVTATPAEHRGSRRPGGPEGLAVGFLARAEHSVYFAGDTDLFDEMAGLGPVDAALLPIAGWGPKLGPGHLDPERAARAASMLRPRVAIPIHWGTYRPTWSAPGPWFKDPPHAFAAQVAEVAPEVEVRVLAPGESLEL